MGEALGGEEYFLVPGTGRAVCCNVPGRLQVKDWSKYYALTSAADTRIDPASIPKELFELCMSPEQTPGLRGTKSFSIERPAKIAASRVCSPLVKLPRTPAELQRFRRECGLSDVPFRASYSWTGGKGLFDANWLFPPAFKVGELLEDWFDFMSCADHPLPLRIALGAPQFLWIHPFPGGNGKTIRAFLCKLSGHRARICPSAMVIGLFLVLRRDVLLRIWARLYAGEIEVYLACISRAANGFSEWLKSGADARGVGRAAEFADLVSFISNFDFDLE